MKNILKFKIFEKIINKSEKDGDIEIDLTGPEGNAFVLIGYANKFAKKLGYTKEQTDKLISDMKSSDYENLIDVFDEHFGSFVTLLR